MKNSRKGNTVHSTGDQRDKIPVCKISYFQFGNTVF